jgi:hypothetical protein
MRSKTMLSSNVIELRVQRVDTGEVLTFRRREAWTMACLIEAGEKGVAPVERPAPHWSGYVFALRLRGLAIETIDERHTGIYPGGHGRYVLRTPVTVLQAVHAEGGRDAA